MMNLDTINYNIIRQLRDGRKSSKAIADDLGVSHNTIRRRMEKLTQKGILEISGLVDTDNLSNHMLAIVGINLRTRKLTNRAQEISELGGG